MSTRRTFLKQAALASGAVMAVATAPGSVLGANERIRLGVAGLSRGRKLCDAFAAQADAELVYLCETDKTRLEDSQKRFSGAKAVGDFRKILDDRSIDAIAIATPDHWHTPMALLAMQAGKHVYVEKPPSHNLREGRLLIEAAKKHQRVVQVGTQNRSNEGVAEAIQMLREGAIGDVLMVKVINSQRRANIGHAEPCDPPETIDYDLWVGPAAWLPYQPNRLHNGWHWFHNFGTGDMGNDGVHDLDIGRWGLGVDCHPSRVRGYGQKLYFDDDQQFPDTQYMTFEYPGDGSLGKRRLLVFEQRIWAPYRQEGFENGDIFYGTKGVLMVGKGDGYWLYGEKNAPVKERKFSMPEEAHQRNFIDAIKGSAQPNASAETGHLSASLSHLGNVCARVGRDLRFDPAKEQFVDDAEADKLLGREYRQGHFAVPG
ncbi:MAG: Gfo/Idh/MocA family protein [Thermoguttaceae bacterium]